MGKPAASTRNPVRATFSYDIWHVRPARSPNLGVSIEFTSQPVAGEPEGRYWSVGFENRRVSVLWWVETASQCTDLTLIIFSRFHEFQIGPSSHFTFVQRIYERLNNQPHDPSASSPASPIPDGVRTWGLESFLFSAPEQQRVSTPKEAFISRNMGERFIRNYFKIVHPQLPILMYSDVMSQWASFCEPPSRHSPPRDRRIVYMVLALGARVSPCSEKHNLELTNGWAEYFLSKTDVSITVLSEPTMHMVQFFLLKVRTGTKRLILYDMSLAIPKDPNDWTRLLMHNNSCDPTRHTYTLVMHPALPHR